jgi:integrase
MATTPRDRLNRQKQKVESLADEGEITPEQRDALLEYADALDTAKARYTYAEDGEEKEFQPRSVEQYLRNLRTALGHGNYDRSVDLWNASAAEVNEFMDALHDDEGLSKTTVIGYQSAVQRFYYYFDLGVDPEDIRLYKERSSPRHDEQDMFTDDEVKALRQACGASGMPVRNRALLEMLIFTGQRLGALLTLRIKDVQPDAEKGPMGSRGYIYLNGEYEEQYGGLKGALVRGRKRPLFGANKYVRDWLDYHPHGDDPEAWLFIGDPSHWKTDTSDHWARPSADQVLRRIGEAAGVDKPVNAHKFRHYCATVLYRDYDLDRDAIRMLFGHVKGSSALEETYSHLFDEDYIQKAEQALGFREEEQPSPLTPDTCPTCGEILEDHWRQCPSCSEVFAPEQTTDAVEGMRDEATEAAVQSSPGTPEHEGAQALREAGADPEALARRIAELEERLDARGE